MGPRLGTGISYPCFKYIGETEITALGLNVSFVWSNEDRGAEVANVNGSSSQIAEEHYLWEVRSEFIGERFVGRGRSQGAVRRTLASKMHSHSRQQPIHHIPMHVRQPEVAALELERQLRVIDAQACRTVALKS